MHDSHGNSHDQRNPAADVITRLFDAVDRHDLDTLEQCFAKDYVNETPVHPSRGFSGREQVRRNWATIFAAVPDITATVIQSQRSPTMTWVECEMTGTRLDGGRHLMRGVLIFGIDADHIQSARFYLEPVDSAELSADEAVAAIVHQPVVHNPTVHHPAVRQPDVQHAGHQAGRSS
jgi:ketosteroid isomerase-like protein